MSTSLSSDSLTTNASFVPTPPPVAPAPVAPAPVAPKVDDSVARNERRRKRNLGF